MDPSHWYHFDGSGPARISPFIGCRQVLQPTTAGRWIPGALPPVFIKRAGGI